MATYPGLCPSWTALAITKKHRNQQLTDYGAKVVEKEIPITIFSRLGTVLGKWEWIWEWEKDKRQFYIVFSISHLAYDTAWHSFRCLQHIAPLADLTCQCCEALRGFADAWGFAWRIEILKIHFRYGSLKLCNFLSSLNRRTVAPSHRRIYSYPMSAKRKM